MGSAGSGSGSCSRLGLDGSSRLCTLGLINSAFALSSTLACGLLGSKTGATLGKGLLLGGRCRLGGILVRIGIVVGRSGFLGLTGADAASLTGSIISD